MRSFASPRRSRLASLSSTHVAVLCTIAVVGCPRPRPPPIVEVDAPDPFADAPFVEPGVDTDRDGLCDATETALGLSTTDPDGDDDGFSDAIEYAIGYDARRMDSPDRATIIYLRETPHARIDAALTFTVNGEGESLSGLFSNVRGVTTHPTLTAFDYFFDAQAIGATPPDAILGVEGERFLGLRDRATLTVRVGFENASVPEGCVRAFAFQYVLRDETSTRIFGSRHGLLVVTPEGVSPAGDTWCPIGPSCY